MDQRIIDNAVKQWRRHLRSVWLRKAVILNILCITSYRKRNAVWTHAAFV